MKPALAFLLLTLTACGDPGDSEPGPAERNGPLAVRYDQHGVAGDLAARGETLVNPVSDDPGAARQGEALFATMNCDGCHGGGALGWVGPSLADGRWQYGGDDGALFHSIFYGRPGGMPAYGGMLSDSNIWLLVSYVQSRPVPDVVPTLAWP